VKTGKSINLITMIYNPTPSSISLWFNGGRILGIIYAIQVLTGIFLRFYYVSYLDISFRNTLLIMKDLNYGYLFRVVHANGASLFFFFIYLHMFRGLLYKSYLIVEVWLRGLVILILLIASAFLGYVLPWGNMRLWGSTVITNLFSVVPFIGDKLVVLLWGDFRVSQSTLSFFFSLHYLLPLVLGFFIFLHLLALHHYMRDSKVASHAKTAIIKFYPYFVIKDLYNLFVYAVLVRVFFVYPWALGDVENFIEANSISSPLHIVPEWYFLFAYAILRAIPSKVGGVIALAIRIVSLFFLPIKRKKFTSLNLVVFWLFIINFIILRWLGGIPTTYPFNVISIYRRRIYFLIVLLL